MPIMITEGDVLTLITCIYCTYLCQTSLFITNDVVNISLKSGVVCRPLYDSTQRYGPGNV